MKRFIMLVALATTLSAAQQARYSTQHPVPAQHDRSAAPVYELYDLDAAPSG
jgi:hypothetical protein